MATSVLGAVVGVAAQGPESRRLRLTSPHYFGDDGALKVSIKRGDVTAGRLLTTARALLSRTEATGVQFFLDPRAAAAFRPFSPEPSPWELEADRHAVATYYQVGPSLARMWVNPFGWRPYGPDNEVTLSADGSRVERCQYQLDSRCLLGLRELDGDLTDLAGMVTVTATLSSRGALSAARDWVVDAPDDARRIRLRDVVQRHLASWWLDLGARPVAVRITYAVGPATSAPAGAELDLEFPESPAAAEQRVERNIEGNRSINPERYRDDYRKWFRQRYFRVAASVLPR